MKRCIFLAWIFPCLVCAQPADEVPWRTITQPDFTIQYPISWTLDDSGQAGTRYLFFSPLDSADSFRDNVNVMVQDLTGYHLDLASYAKLSEDQVTSMMANSKILESIQVTSKNVTFHKIVYTGDLNMRNLKFEQYYFVNDNKAYVLTLACEQRQFDRFQMIGERMLNSFRLKN